jgi:hypothetical protein
VYNILGQQVATLEEGVRAAGTWPAKWDARNNASGVYIIRFEASGTRDLTKSFLQVERIILQK